MKKYLFVTVAASCLFAACTKEADHIIPSSEELFYINAVASETDPNLKSSVDDATAAFTWSTGDQIAVYAGKYVMSQPLESTYGGSANAQFAFTAGNNASRADFAVFPASLVFDGSSVRSSSASSHTASALTITLPASYTLAQVQDNEVSTPMIATNAPDGSLAFKQLGALLRVTLDNVPKQTRAITFDFNGKKVQGEFTLSSVEPGTTALATSATDDVDDIITVLTPDIAAFTSGLVINLPIPTGAYGSLTVTTWDAASSGHKINAITFTIRSNGADWEPVRKSSGKRSAILPVFSVSASKKVVLAPGMLQAVIQTAPVLNTTPAVADHWQFASEQFTIVGNNSGNKNMEAGATVDLFCWVGESATVDSYGLITLTAHSDDFNGNTAGELLKSDWGKLTIRDADGGDYAPNTWFTCTGSEWNYFGASRATSTLSGKANARYAKAQVNGIYGVLMFPDHYEHPAGVDLPKSDSINHGSTSISWKDNTEKYTAYSLADWKKMEAAGCAFLPATGLRQVSGGNPSVGSTGSTVYAMAYSMTVNSHPSDKTKQANWSTTTTATYPNATGGIRWNGKGVRLMRQVN